ncbi:hypothetical protein GCM10011387_31970 [Pedobacter quisquiliarum]|jgi:hypothetical protein|uniref:DUF7695 domain-containing protein n=1 Tax=Pedobacter quisquiliarum TaxID=1834438 RepID=A0A916UKN9_9SPHI|nr:hypothetical protein [Pedobacter quisquiliarum]GGC75796.1 hypothetical protein GCM10011387_31970 [Pedobacter quisquiliarum]
MDILTDKPDLASNQAVCFNCENVLTSKDQYDMVLCSCGAMAVDGEYHLRIIEIKENPAHNGGLPPLAKNGFIMKF